MRVRLLATVGLSLLLAGMEAGSASAAAVMPPANTAATVSANTLAAPAPDGLVTTSDEDTRLAGGLSLGENVVSFDSSTVSPVESTASITINGKKFTASRDIKKGTAHWTGGGTSLQPADREALLEFDHRLLTKIKAPMVADPKATAPAYEDLLARLSALLAEAPLPPGCAGGRRGCSGAWRADPQ